MAQEQATESLEAPPGGEMDRHAGRYLTFSLASERYGVDILAVQEIIGCQDITRVPDSPPHLKGVINLRGQVIAVVDLRLRFGLPEKPRSEETCIIIVEAGSLATGMIVDKVEEVVELPPGSVEPPPRFHDALDTDAILGMGKHDDCVVILLHCETVLSVARR